MHIERVGPDVDTVDRHVVHERVDVLRATKCVGPAVEDGEPVATAREEERREEAALPDAPRVHVVCGGGSGVSVMGALGTEVIGKAKKEEEEAEPPKK